MNQSARDQAWPRLGERAPLHRCFGRPASKLKRARRAREKLLEQCSGIGRKAGSQVRAQLRWPAMCVCTTDKTIVKFRIAYRGQNFNFEYETRPASDPWGAGKSVIKPAGLGFKSWGRCLRRADYCIRPKP